MSLDDSVNYSKKSFKMIINKSFSTTTDINERTIEVAEAFGLGIDDEQKFDIYKNFTFGFDLNDIVYISGDSGSGKTILLNEIKNKFENDFIDYDDIVIDDNEILINGIGKDLNESIKFLSIVGLNDAFLFLRQYKHLSDGQKRRYKIAKMLFSDKKILIFDEFLATLDRETAKIISFNLQKNIRKMNKILIVATTHNDLYDDLSPNVYIYKKFNDEIITKYSDKINSKCSIIQNSKLLFIKIDKLKYDFYLSKYHYKSSSNMNYKHIYGLYLNNNLIGSILISCPHINLKGRNQITSEYKVTSSESMRKLNNEFECISRIVLHPKFRGIGLAQYMLQEYFKLSETKYIETIAVMTKYNPFFEKSGMIKVNYEKKEDDYNKLMNELSSLGFNIKLIKSIKYLKSHFNELDNDKKLVFIEIVKKLYNRYNSIVGGTARYNINVNMFENNQFCELFKRMLKNDIEYLYYENKSFKKQGEQKWF